MNSNVGNSLNESAELQDDYANNPAKKKRLSLEQSGASDTQGTSGFKEKNASHAERGIDEPAAMAATQAQLNAHLVSQMECPVCLDICWPPVFMCLNGHIVCAKCQPQLEECGTCRAPGKPVARCLPLETVAALFKQTCPNKSVGCQLELDFYEMSKHVPLCEYGFKCFLCETWKGCEKDLKVHVLTKHSEKCIIFPPNSYANMYTSQPTREDCQDKILFAVCLFNDDIFWIESCFSSETRIYSIAVGIASHDAEKASRYSYCIEFKADKEKNNHSLFYQGDVQTLDARDGGMEAVLPPPIIDSYVDGYIKYTLKISLKN